MSQPDLVIFGCLTLDNVVTAAGERLPQTFGGNCLYAALGARLWHDRVGIVSRCGAGYPEACFDLLRDVGIATAGIRRVDQPHGRNMAFVYRADGSRTRVFPPEVIAAIPPAERARFVDTTLLPNAEELWHACAPGAADMPDAWWGGVTGVHNAFMPVAKHRDVAAAVRARHGARTWLQIDSPWHDHLAPHIDHATPLLSALDAVLPSEVDLERFRPDTPFDATLAAMVAHGARTIVLKRGAAGCAVFEAGCGCVAEIGALPVPVADPTGAGDAFCGGFLAGVRLTGDVVAAARYGTVSASFAVESAGVERLARVDRGAAAARLAALAV
jgi:sugar/nucleoside kinase (ribokinase family)